MAGTAPIANDSAAWAIAVSNLVEVTQTRSVYGHVMNKRAASGASSSDTNSRTEPLVGAMVVLHIWQDAVGTPREETMKWVVELLFPTLLGWNEWAWARRRYNVGRDSPHGGLLVLGNDLNTLPCEGGNITTPPQCGSHGGAILESGMDNSPMYYNTFNDQAATYDTATGEYIGRRRLSVDSFARADRAFVRSFVWSILSHVPVVSGGVSTLHCTFCTFNQCQRHRRSRGGVVMMLAISQDVCSCTMSKCRPYSCLNPCRSNGLPSLLGLHQRTPVSQSCRLKARLWRNL